MNQVRILHKEFNEPEERTAIEQQLVSSNIMTAVHKRITSKYEQIPFSLRTRPFTWSRKHQIIGNPQFLTFYIEETIELPSVISRVLNKIDFEHRFVGALDEFTYLGEINKSFNIHVGFYRHAHLTNRTNDWVQTNNQNLFVVYRPYDTASDQIHTIFKEQFPSLGHHITTVRQDWNCALQLVPNVTGRVKSINETSKEEGLIYTSYEVGEIQSARNVYIKLREYNTKLGDTLSMANLLNCPTDIRIDYTNESILKPS